MRRLICSLAFLLVAAAPLSAQEIFRSVHSANLPTAEILPQGSWLFEISHRTVLPFSEGPDALWGLDGPMLNRLGLTYSAHERVALGILRTNAFDNIELNAKVGLYAGGSEALPVKVAAMGGVSWNPDVTVTSTVEDNEMQAYGQLIVNALIAERFALGIVPTFLSNPRLADAESESAFYVGVNGQVYLTPAMSVLVEWVAGDMNPETPNDPLTFGIEFNTGGHVFKLLSTNQARMNPAQLFGGAAVEFEPKEWLFGFNITRLLPF
ncbi:MAG: DUF5777 family beta-barrel protein [Gemmatimonadales bacterium]